MRVKVACGVFVLAVVALPVLAQPVATESLSVTGLSIAPQIAYERAMLRVSGPEGYEGLRVFENGESIQMDLSTFGKRPSGDAGPSWPGGVAEGSRSDLPDGRYKLEAVFMTDGRSVGVHTSTFFVEGGLAISREAKRAQIGDLRGDLMRQGQARESQVRAYPREGAGGFEVAGATMMPESYATADFLGVFDGANDGITYLTLDTNYPVINDYFLVVNNQGDLQFSENTAYQYAGSTPWMTVERGGEIGIGTTAPSADLHVASASGQPQIRIEDVGSSLFALETNSNGIWFRDEMNAGTIPFWVWDNTPRNALLSVGDGSGNVRVGIGAGYSPATTLHVVDADPQVLVESDSVTTTGRTLAYMKNSGDVRMFWENTASGDIWQMSMLSTVLQMATPTGNGKFRVRKSGGLQALNGSTEIMALNSTGDLTVKSVTQTSSREEKLGFESVDAVSVLEKVAGLPISEWSYRADNPSVRHLGPMSEDFHAAFGLGKTDKGLTSIDASGVALAAIQGLVQENRRLEERIADLEEMVQALAEH